MDEYILTLSPREIANGIENMEIRGAALIARSAALTMKKAAESYEGDDIKDFKGVMEDIAVFAGPLILTEYY